MSDKDRRSLERREVLAVRVSEEVHTKIKDLALKEHRNVNQQVSKLLAEALEHRGELEAA